MSLPPGMDPDSWRRAGRRLLVKMISEFAYEEIIRPEPDTEPDQESRPEPDTETEAAAGSGARSGTERTASAAAPPGAPATRLYRLRVSDDLTLRFRARRGAYGHWIIDPASLTPAGTDPFALLLRAHDTLLGLTGDTTGHLIRELSVTLLADVRLSERELPAARLAELGYAELEGHQKGHPWLVANKGRLGFSVSDAARWAPEARREQCLPWLAVRTGLADYRGVPTLAEPHRLYERELGPETLREFRHTLRSRGLPSEDYLFLPVHPWQWDETIAPLFADSLAKGDIVPLRTDGDLRLPQQSVRTFLNTSRPERHTVKLPLSVLNTLVWRGLPTERTLAAPAVTRWIHGLRDGDAFLRDECRVILLGEVASVTVRHPLYDRLPQVPYQYRELLGCIWREPLTGQLDSGERARTLASLIHTDAREKSLTAELVERSGLPPRVWLRRLFAAVLPPLLHFLYRYGTVFSPHGENAIVVFDEDDVPVRLAVKDFVDDVNVSADPVPELEDMPDEVREVLLTEPPQFLTQFIHSGLFVGVFRYLAPLCEEQLRVPEGEFWSLLRAETERHHARFPELKDRFSTFDLLTPRIERLCLNRNRLHMDGYRDSSERPHAAVHGTVANPLHLA
ncbi:IucA/IucC family siderophore biosynthesis protein [Streptomyces bathyalis]|uniref:IucA/IucC family siderophore biosynthesis protein n=1 Tax=Streptomyces bathyalis TaxID=2710756 RepID=A0A7T1TCJ3_9ACTN|nr:IucA/IucC family siderophore biosynthesis protein [Streptomyces bathyalis]QPP10484.1 IucA/IucC family siderophore biosynthesis protein [Streptomyces bathyalis]